MKIEDIPVSFIDETRDLKPEAICDTIQFNSITGKFDITAEWKTIVQRSFTLAELNKFFGITDFNQLTVEQFLFALVFARSASRSSISEVVESVNECLAGLGADPDGYGYGDREEVQELRRLRDELIDKFFARVGRNTITSAPIETNILVK